MDKDKDCMLKEITRFLIRVGEHCMECNKNIAIEPTVADMVELDSIKEMYHTLLHPEEVDPKPKIKADITYMVPTMIAPKKKYKHNVKKSYLEKWIRKGLFEVFTLDQFYKAYPLQRKNRNLTSIISRLIADKKIIQLGKDKFKVINGG